METEKYNKKGQKNEKGTRMADKDSAEAPTFYKQEIWAQEKLCVSRSHS